MKSCSLFKGFTLSAIVLALCASLSTAAPRSITLGNAEGSNYLLDFLSTTAGVANDPNNPNQFPVYFAESNAGLMGFLLDGSEWSNVMMKRFEDAHANGGNVTIYYDDNVSGIKIENSFLGPNIPTNVYKIAYISTSKR